MWSRQKVKKMDVVKDQNGKIIGYAAPDDPKAVKKIKDDQQYYEKKVKNLIIACEDFEDALNSMKSFEIGRMERYFKECFRDFLKKMFSKTSRILNDMDKKLKKLKNKTLLDKKNNIDNKLVDEIKKAFKYDLPKEENSKEEKEGFIKRSAIYDGFVHEYFVNSLPSVIDDLAQRAKQEAGKNIDEKVVAWISKKKQAILSEVDQLKNEIKNLREKLEKLENLDAVKELEKKEEEIKKFAQQLKELNEKYNAELQKTQDLANQLNSIENTPKKSALDNAREQLEEYMKKKSAGGGGGGDGIAPLPVLGIDPTFVTAFGYDALFNEKGGMGYKNNHNKFFVKIGEGAAGSYKSVEDLIESLAKDLEIFIRNYDMIADGMEAKDEKTIKEAFDSADRTLDGFWKNVEAVKSEIDKLLKKKNNDSAERQQIVGQIEEGLEEKFNALKAKKAELEKLKQKMFVCKSQETARIITEYKSVYREARKIVEKEIKNNKNVKQVAKDVKDQKGIIGSLIKTVVAIKNGLVSDIGELNKKGTLDVFADTISALSMKREAGGILNRSITSLKNRKKNDDIKKILVDLNTVVQKITEASKNDSDQNAKNELQEMSTILKNASTAYTNNGQVSDDDIKKIQGSAEKVFKTNKAERKALSDSQEEMKKNIKDELANLSGSITSKLLKGSKIISGNKDLKAKAETMLAAVGNALTACNEKVIVVDNIKGALATAKVNVEELIAMLSKLGNITAEELEKLESNSASGAKAEKASGNVLEEFKKAGDDFIKASKSTDADKYTEAMKNYNAQLKKLLGVEKFANLKDAGKPKPKPKQPKPVVPKLEVKFDDNGNPLAPNLSQLPPPVPGSASKPPAK